MPLDERPPYLSHEPIHQLGQAVPGRPVHGESLDLAPKVGQDAAECLGVLQIALRDAEEVGHPLRREPLLRQIASKLLEGGDVCFLTLLLSIRNEDHGVYILEDQLRGGRLKELAPTPMPVGGARRFVRSDCARRAQAHVSCYLSSMKRKNGIAAIKVSVSVADEDLKILKRRAKRLYDGNLSAVIHELAQKAKKQEAMERLIATLGGPSLTDDDRRAIDAEWAGK